MGADLPIDSSDRNSDRAGSGVQNASDGARGALVEGLNPETSQGDADRGRTGDENGKAKRAHSERVAAGPDGLAPLVVRAAGVCGRGDLDPVLAAPLGVIETSVGIHEKFLGRDGEWEA